MARWHKLLLLSSFFSASLFFSSILFAFDNDSKVDVSTTPIGSPFLRHYACDYNLNLKDLVKFEKRGFGHTEIITLSLISQKTGKPMKEYGKRRLKDQVTLRDLAKEAGMNYDDLYKESRQIKAKIEARGDRDLPPPIFEEKPKEGDKGPSSSEKDKNSDLDDKPQGP